jgi:uncharacterized protein
MTPFDLRSDPRRPLLLDTRELGRRPGSLRRVRRSVPAPAGLAVPLVGVPAGRPVALELRLESVVDGVLVTGTAATSVAGECARCLEPFAADVVADLQELYAYPEVEPVGPADDLARLVDDRIDLEPLLRDALVLALPLTPLCAEDCRGLCPGCGERWDHLPADHGHAPPDPRWAALAELFPPRPTPED